MFDANPNHQYISLQQASSITQLSPRTLRRAIAAQRLKAHRIGRMIRINQEELARWIEADGQPPTAKHDPSAPPGITPAERRNGSGLKSVRRTQKHH